MTPKILPTPLVGAAKKYNPSRCVTPTDLHLDGNEGSLPSASLLEELVTEGPQALRRYPDAGQVEAELARSIGIDSDRVIVTAGGDDALERIIRAMLCEGREMILPVPTFEMFERYADLTGATIKQVPWLEGNFPIESVINTISPKTALITVVTPNNPTGLVATSEDLKRLSAAAPNALLLVDLAYTEFADEDLTCTALELPNAVAVRSMSKAWGLAGLRVGWAAGPKEVIEWMRAAGHPYAVSSLSLKIASSRLAKNVKQVEEFTQSICLERKMLTTLLKARGSTVLPSQGNFVMARFNNSNWVKEALAGFGIAVRGFGKKQYLEDALRITLPGNGAAFERLTKAISTALAPQAFLFDLNDDLPKQKEILERLSKRIKLGIISDLTMAGVNDFLVKNKIRDLFAAVLTKEDAPAKPNPKSVFVALRRLDVDRAWMICKNETDVEAARAGQVLPLGIVPGLDKKGAGRVLENLRTLEELLS